MLSKIKSEVLRGPAFAVLIAGGLLFAAIWYASQAAHAEAVQVRMPKLSAMGQAGQRSFAKNCAQCHGAQAGGTDQGPPLIHRIYESNHHGDGAFLRAATSGTRQHHWRYGDMPPQPQIRRMEIQAIIKFIREVQRANGIN
ncbi:MAG: cytochrome c [Alphaproteobacteria bacterium]|jgi:mono/diheme cytochrome c family protein|nr:cytochrome c [Alphaproteobacteria bacterium]